MLGKAGLLPLLVDFNLTRNSATSIISGLGRWACPRSLDLYAFPMARKWSNQNLPGALHFITGNFLNRLPIFKQDACCESFVENLATLLSEWPSKLIAYVLMPDHFHMIVNPRDGRVIEFTGKLKSLSGRAISIRARNINFQRDSEGSVIVWQDSFKATPFMECLDDLAED